MGCADEFSWKPIIDFVEQINLKFLRKVVPFWVASNDWDVIKKPQEPQQKVPSKMEWFPIKFRGAFQGHQRINDSAVPFTIPINRRWNMVLRLIDGWSSGSEVLK